MYEQTLYHIIGLAIKVGNPQRELDMSLRCFYKNTFIKKIVLMHIKGLLQYIVNLLSSSTT